VETNWYSRPVLFVADINISVGFYAGKLGFSLSWQHQENGTVLVAQVERDGCELILSSQWPDKTGSGLIFISLDVSVLRALRSELEGKGVDVRDGSWGYPLMIIRDPDGNELFFPYPSAIEPRPDRSFESAPTEAQ
jgi:catechol 2,3-dioxygenase-like lactoylglutathione lyase family enzyme